MPLVGKPKSASVNPQERAVANSRFVASLYVNRRKVWEGRANSYEEAANKAKQEKSKYHGTKSSIVIRESQ